MFIFLAVEKFYTISPTDQPTSFEYTTQIEINSDEDPYTRTKTINGRYIIETGWVEQAGWFVIHNKGPTTCFLHYAHQDPILEMPPKATTKFLPMTYDGLTVTSSEETKITYTVFPK